MYVLSSACLPRASRPGCAKAHSSAVPSYFRRGPPTCAGRNARANWTSPCRTADAIRRKAYALYLDVCKPGARLRSIGVRATDLLPAEVEQPSFLPEYQAVQRREKLENTIDSIRSRFGHFSIQPAANLLDTQLSGLNPQAAIDPFTA